MSLFSSDYRGISAKTNGLSDSKYGEGEAATRGVTRNGLILFESRWALKQRGKCIHVIIQSSESRPF